jgi:ADP-heptose:LPS heptosyltransferase
VYKIVNRKKRILTKLADILGNLLTFPLRLLFKKNKPILPEDIKQILLIRTAYIGDVIMTLPMLKPLKEKFLGASITVMTSLGGREILLNNPYVDDILVYEPFWFYASSLMDYLKFLGQLRKRRFDLTIEARADIRDILLLVFPSRSQAKLSYDVGGGGFLLSHIAPYEKLKHKVEYHLDLARFLGCDTDALEWGIYLTKNEKEEVAQLLRNSGVLTPFICAHPGGRLPLKRWSPHRCASLYDRMIDRFELPLVILSAGSEIGLAGQIAGMMRNRPILLAGKTTIRQLSGVIAEAALLVCNDSAPMHIAAALGTPTVAIFGPSKSIETRPYENGHLVIEKDFPCRWFCDETRCTNNKYHACMEAITVDDVFQAIERQRAFVNRQDRQ